MMPNTNTANKSAKLKQLFKLSLLLSTSTAAGTCLADWTGGIEAGARIGENAPALRFFAANDSHPLSHYAYLDWIRDSSNSNYRIGYNPKFKVSESVYSFGRFSIEDDDPGAVDREIDAVVGVGNNLFRRGSTQIKVETGLGAEFLSFDDSTESDEGFVFLAGNISTGVLPIVRFDMQINTQASNDQTVLDGEAAFSIPIAPGTALSYVYRVTRRDLEDRDDTVDEETFVKVVYGF